MHIGDNKCFTNRSHEFKFQKKFVVGLRLNSTGNNGHTNRGFNEIFFVELRLNSKTDNQGFTNRGFYENSVVRLRSVSSK